MKSFRFLAIALVLAISFPVLAQTSGAPAQSGAKLSKSQVQTLTATASTPAEHLRLAHYFTAESHRYAAEAKEHMALKAQYQKNPMTNNTKMSKGTVDHCDYIAKSLNEASAQAEELAKMHEAMATDSGKK